MQIVYLSINCLLLTFIFCLIGFILIGTRLQLGRFGVVIWLRNNVLVFFTKRCIYCLRGALGGLLSISVARVRSSDQIGGRLIKINYDVSWLHVRQHLSVYFDFEERAHLPGYTIYSFFLYFLAFGG